MKSNKILNFKLFNESNSNMSKEEFIGWLEDNEWEESDDGRYTFMRIDSDYGFIYDFIELKNDGVKIDYDLDVDGNKYKNIKPSSVFYKSYEDFIETFTY